MFEIQIRGIDVSMSLWPDYKNVFLFLAHNSQIRVLTQGDQKLRYSWNWSDLMPEILYNSHFWTIYKFKKM